MGPSPHPTTLISTLHLTFDSSCLVGAAYSPEGTLDVAFVNGLAYRYFAVPPAVIEALLLADSKGAFFNREIRPRYASERLRP